MTIYNCRILRGDYNGYEDICSWNHISITLVLSSIALTPITTLHASSKGLKLYPTVDTKLNDDVRINTYQYEDKVFTHDASIQRKFSTCVP